MSVDEIEKLFKQKADYYDNVLKAFNEYRSAAYGTKANLIQWLADYSVFTLLGSYDLWIIHCDYHKSVKVFQQNYYARQASLICFELLQDVSQLCNEKYSELLIKRISDKEIVTEAIDVRKILHKFRNENEKKFKDIRDITIAHRDHNISTQIEIINNMDNNWILGFTLEFLQLIERLHLLLGKAINYIQKDSPNLNNDTFFKKYNYEKSK